MVHLYHNHWTNAERTTNGERTNQRTNERARSMDRSHERGNFSFRFLMSYLLSCGWLNTKNNNKQLRCTMDGSEKSNWCIYAKWAGPEIDMRCYMQMHEIQSILDGFVSLLHTDKMLLTPHWISRYANHDERSHANSVVIVTMRARFFFFLFVFVFFAARLLLISTVHQIDVELQIALGPRDRIFFLSRTKFLRQLNETIRLAASSQQNQLEYFCNLI